MIEELLDKYHVEDYDKLLIDIINHMIERKEIIYERNPDTGTIRSRTLGDYNNEEIQEE